MTPRCRRALLAALALALVTAGTRADDDHTWTPMDTTFEVTFGVSLAIDSMQTYHFLRNAEPGERLPREEGNPILGARPSTAKLLAYELTAMTAHVVIARLLPRPYRRIWQVVWIGVEVYTIGRNCHTSGGFEVALPW